MATAAKTAEPRAPTFADGTPSLESTLRRSGFTTLVDALAQAATPGEAGAKTQQWQRPWDGRWGGRGLILRGQHDTVEQGYRWLARRTVGPELKGLRCGSGCERMG